MSKENTSELELDFGPDGSTLVPVVTQDATSGAVLLLAFANRAAYDETLKSGLATYWSRRRNTLWTKGLTSGDTLAVREIRINCEQNSLLYLVEMQGEGACHAKSAAGRHYPTCYYRRIKGDRLESV